MEIRTADAVGHRVAGPAVRPVAEPFRQLQQLEAGGLVLLRTDRPVWAGAGGDDRAAVAGSRRQFLQRQHPDRAGAHGAAAEERTTIGIDWIVHGVRSLEFGWTWS